MRKRIPVIILVISIVGLLSSGCKEGSIKFSHKNHIQRGVECETCHTVKQGGELPAIPDMATCTTCHDVDMGAGLKEIKGHRAVPAECKKCHTGIPREKKAGRIKSRSLDFKFSHENHYKEQKIQCLTCHQGMDKGEKDVSYKTLRPELCLECHEKSKEKIVPQNHRVGWKRTHGQLIKEGPQPLTEAECSYCHRKDSCVDCHQNNPPADHTNYWRQRGHSIASEIDRDRCARCHQMDYCVRCHEQTAPRNHTAGWSGSSQRHCSVCHWPLNSVGCWTCHKGTPGHDTAPDRPGGTAHASGNDCRACHMPGAGLPHPDDGESCERCHK